MVAHWTLPKTTVSNYTQTGWGYNLSLYLNQGKMQSTAPKIQAVDQLDPTTGVVQATTTAILWLILASNPKKYLDNRKTRICKSYLIFLV